MSDLERIGFSSSFGANVSFDREICGNLTEDYKKVLILILIYKLLCLHEGRSSQTGGGGGASNWEKFPLIPVFVNKQVDMFFLQLMRPLVFFAGTSISEENKRI